MSNQCTDPDKQEVKAILMKLKEFTDDPQKKEGLQNKIKKCAKTIPISEINIETLEELKTVLLTAGISETDITAIVALAQAAITAQAATTQPEEEPSGSGAEGASGTGAVTTAAQPVAQPVGGKRKSNKNKSKKSKSKKRRSKRRKHRKMRRTRR